MSDKTATTVTLDVNGKSVQTTLGNLGYKWSNKTVVDEAVNTGKIGNIIKRYKDGLDLQHNGMKFNVEIVLYDANGKDAKEVANYLC